MLHSPFETVGLVVFSLLKNGCHLNSYQRVIRTFKVGYPEFRSMVQISKGLLVLPDTPTLCPSWGLLTKYCSHIFLCTSPTRSVPSWDFALDVLEKTSTREHPLPSQAALTLPVLPPMLVELQEFQVSFAASPNFPSIKSLLSARKCAYYTIYTIFLNERTLPLGDAFTVHSFCSRLHSVL